MKKILFTAVSALAMGAAIAADSTQFGVLKVPSSTTNTIVSVPWLESGTGSDSVTVSNLVLTSGLSNGDTIKLFENGAYTKTWVLDNGVWTGGNVVSGNNDVKQSGNDQTTIARGKAIMLTRTGNDLSKGFYIMGKPASAGVQVTLGSGYSLVAPPSVAAVDVNTGITWNNIDAKDKLMVPSISGTTMTTLSWVDPKGANNRKWCVFSQSQFKWEESQLKIPAGAGAWFINGGEGSGTKSFTFGTVAQ